MSLSSTYYCNSLLTGPGSYIVRFFSIIKLLCDLSKGTDEITPLSVNMSQSRLYIAHTTKRPLLLAILSFLLLTPAGAIAADFIELKLDQHSYRIELARTPAERRQGLMHRQQLDRFGGMMLIYSRSGDHRIWMKNMSIALRVYWIDSDFKVIDSKRLLPCLEDPCPVYSAAKFSRYVLELSDHDHRLQPGDRINELTNL